jgi:amino acid transporter
MTDSGSLPPNALGLVGAAAFGAVMLSPALGIYGNFAAIEGTTGVVTSFVFLVALVISLPTAVSYAVVARELPAAGSAYTWLWRVTRPRLGSWVGWLMTSYYVVVIFLQACWPPPGCSSRWSTATSRLPPRPPCSSSCSRWR